LPYVFITHLERVMDANKDLKGGITVHGVSINNLRFACDIDLTEASSTLENVTRFTYLGSVFSYDSDCSEDL